MSAPALMKWSFRIVTILGTEVRIHATFALLLAFVAWQSMSQGGGVSAALESILLVCAMFTCVLLHEFGHVLAARRYGIQTPDITLLPIGGVARLERMPRKPSEELVVALCGPLVNVVIAAVIAIVSGVMIPHGPGATFMRAGHFWMTLMEWNMVMVFFNLVPAFPMDGGRVLRALLAMMTDDYTKATRWAAGIGQALAVLVVIWMVLAGAFQPMLLLIAFFVFFAAGQEAEQVTSHEAARNLKVRDAMLTDYRALLPTALLREAVDHLLAGSQHDFPVLDEHGGMMGIVTRHRLIEALANHGPGYPAQLIIEKCEISLDPSMALAPAMDRLNASTCPALPVIDPLTDRLVGLLTAENVGETLLVRAALRQRMSAINAR